MSLRFIISFKSFLGGHAPRPPLAWHASRAWMEFILRWFMAWPLFCACYSSAHSKHLFYVYRLIQLQYQDKEIIKHYDGEVYTARIACHFIHVTWNASTGWILWFRVNVVWCNGVSLERIRTIKVCNCITLVVYSYGCDRTVILMVICEGEVNVYGQRKFESVMALKYVYIYYYCHSFIHFIQHTV